MFPFVILGDIKKAFPTHVRKAIYYIVFYYIPNSLLLVLQENNNTE